MAGTPKKREVLARVKERGGFGPIFDRVADGESLQAIATDYGCSRQTLFGILNSKKLEPSLRGAYKRAAHAHVEKATELVDSVNPDGPNGHTAIAKAKLQADHRKWLAEKLDREFFGEPKSGVSVTVNVDELWLNAVKSVQKPAKIHAELPSGEIVDAEIIEEKQT